MKRVKSETTYTGNNNPILNQAINPMNDYELSQMTPVQHSGMNNNMSAHTLIQNHSFTTGVDYSMNVDYNTGSQFTQYSNMSTGDFNTVNNNNNYYAWSDNSVPLTHTNTNRAILAPSQQKPQIQQTISSSIEDTLEDSIKYSIKVIHQSYSEYLSTIVECMNEDLKRNNHYNNNLHHQNNNNNYQMYQQSNNMHQQNPNPNFNSSVQATCVSGSFEEIMKYFGFYARKFVRFSQNIPGKLFDIRIIYSCI